MANLVQRGTSLEACLTAAAQQLRNCTKYGKKNCDHFQSSARPLIATSCLALPSASVHNTRLAFLLSPPWLTLLQQVCHSCKTFTV